MESPIYFMSKIFKGVVSQYNKIERLTLAVVVTNQKLRPYFREHQKIGKNILPRMLGPQETISSRKGVILGILFA